MNDRNRGAVYMIKIDLITGFLGAGKTTFIKKYAEYLASQGYRIGIIENDFGAVNVDILMLQDILGDRIDVEQIVGGSVVEDWKRRFRTKLISMAMLGFNRILVEPSGIYDVDAFFDVLRDEPIDTWYEAGNIFMIQDARMDEALSVQEEYLLVSQAASAGRLILSKAQDATQEEMQCTVSRLNSFLEKYDCSRRFTAENVLARDWDSLTSADFETLTQSGWVPASHGKLWFDHRMAFNSLFFMNPELTPEQLETVLPTVFQNTQCGTILRIKGYLPMPEGGWLQINATAHNTVMTPVAMGQAVLIVIGQELKEEIIRPFLYPDHH